MLIHPVPHQMKILFIQVKIFELDSYQCHKFHQQQFFLKYQDIQDLKIEDLLFNGNLQLHFIVKMKHVTELFYEEGWSIYLLIYFVLDTYEMEKI